MNLVSKLLLFVLAVAGAGGLVRAADAPPRLWEVIGKNERGAAGKFYILPVTHNGLDVEYDDYFYKVVVPIALKADVFLHENATLVPRDVPACAAIKRMRSSLGTDVRFYALGFMHVVQPASNNHFCDGLLVRLRKDGLTVRLVR